MKKRFSLIIMLCMAMLSTLSAQERSCKDYSVSVVEWAPHFCTSYEKGDIVWRHSYNTFTVLDSNRLLINGMTYDIKSFKYNHEDNFYTNTCSRFWFLETDLQRFSIHCLAREFQSNVWFVLREQLDDLGGKHTSYTNHKE